MSQLRQTKAISIKLRGTSKPKIKEHLFACGLKSIEKEPEIRRTATKRSSIAEHLVNDRDCARKYDISRLKIIHHFINIFDIVKMDAVSIFLK